MMASKSPATKGRAAARARKTGKKGAEASPRRSTPKTPRPVEVLDPDLDPGAPDPADVAETARPSSIGRNEVAGIAGGDLDASFHGLDSGEEAVGGSDPTPDQDEVDEIGSALGIMEPVGEPLATTERIAARDRDRWELDPESAEDLEERERDDAIRRRRHLP